MYSHLLNQAAVVKERQIRSPSICVIFVDVEHFSILGDDLIWSGCESYETEGTELREHSRRGACGSVTT